MLKSSYSILNSSRRCLLASHCAVFTKYKHTTPVHGNDFQLQYLSGEKEGKCHFLRAIINVQVP